MGGFLGAIWDAVSGLITFVVHGVESLLTLLTLIPQYLAALINLIAYLPTLYQGAIIATISVSIIFLITNRGKGG